MDTAMNTAPLFSIIYWWDTVLVTRSSDIAKQITNPLQGVRDPGPPIPDLISIGRIYTEIRTFNAPFPEIIEDPVPSIVTEAPEIHKAWIYQGPAKYRKRYKSSY
jgi:hypothetical protein